MNENNLLSGIRIIDFTRLLPGPLATHMLAQMGAEVIKIEHPDRPDYARAHGKQIDGASTLFHSLNHNKEVKTISYDTVEGKQEIFQLLQSADAIIEQFRSGAMDAWNLGYEDCKKVNEKIVFISLTGYGLDNEMSHAAGHDINYLATAGLLSQMTDGEGTPILPGFQLADICGGSYTAVIAALAGIIKAKSLGAGDHLDVSMTKALIPLMTIPILLEADGMSEFNVLDGKKVVNYGVYECQDAGFVTLGALELKFWNRFCEVVSKPEWKTDNQLSLSAQVFPQKDIITLFQSKSRDEWAETGRMNDICLTPVLTVKELLNSSFITSTGAIKKTKTPKGQEFLTISLPFTIK